MDWAQHYCDRNIPGARPVYYNTTARNPCLRMIPNWCGDDRFVSKVAWQLIYEIGNPFNTFPEAWDRPSYLFKIPYLKEAGRFMNTHSIVGDTSISRAISPISMLARTAATTWTWPPGWRTWTGTSCRSCPSPCCCPAERNNNRKVVVSK